MPGPAPGAGHKAINPSCPQGAFILVESADKKQENPQTKLPEEVAGGDGSVRLLCQSLRHATLALPLPGVAGWLSWAPGAGPHGTYLKYRSHYSQELPVVF